MAEYFAKQGATEIWSDGEKIVIKNPTGFKWIKTNVDTLLGEGEFDKIYEVKYYHNEIAGKINPAAKHVEICSGYIPEVIKKDLTERYLPGISESDLVNKYFDRRDEED